MSETKRWVVVAPSEESGCTLLLAKAANDEQLSRVGNQTGGRVFLFLHTDDFHRDYDHMRAHGVEFQGFVWKSLGSDRAEGYLLV